jgi:HSP20 family protein
MQTRFDTVKEFDRIADELLSASRSARTLALDAYRVGDHVVMHLDLPGVDPGSIDLTIDRGVLGIRAQRTERTEPGGQDAAVQWLARERFGGTFQRQIALGDTLDAEQLAATYDAGVLTITVPVAERAKPRKIAVTAPGSHDRQAVKPAQQQVLHADAVGQEVANSTT